MHPGDTVQPNQDSASGQTPGYSDTESLSEPEHDMAQQDTASHDGEQSANHKDNTRQIQMENPATSAGVVEWRSVEYVSHDKSAAWYALLTVLAVAATALIYFVTKDYVSAGVIIVVAVIFGLSAYRKPRTVDFSVSEYGVQIGSKQYPYASFKSFSIVVEGTSRAILLVPLKRFMPPTSINYPQDKEDDIALLLSRFLPFEQRESDPVDRLMRRIHF